MEQRPSFLLFYLSRSDYSVRHSTTVSHHGIPSKNPTVNILPWRTALVMPITHTLHPLSTMPRSQQATNFVCGFPGCGRSYQRKEHLTRHQMNHFRAQPLKCPYCSSTFLRT
ncbi:Zinc finger C2H2-type protein, partial [Macrophomina phaseolina MS6]